MAFIKYFALSYVAFPIWVSLVLRESVMVMVETMFIAGTKFLLSNLGGVWIGEQNSVFLN